MSLCTEAGFLLPRHVPSCPPGPFHRVWRAASFTLLTLLLLICRLFFCGITRRTAFKSSTTSPGTKRAEKAFHSPRGIIPFHVLSPLSLPDLPPSDLTQTLSTLHHTTRPMLLTISLSFSHLPSTACSCFQISPHCVAHGSINSWGWSPPHQELSQPSPPHLHPEPGQVHQRASPALYKWPQGDMHSCIHTCKATSQCPYSEQAQKHNVCTHPCTRKQKAKGSTSQQGAVHSLNNLHGQDFKSAFLFIQVRADADHSH